MQAVLTLEVHWHYLSLQHRLGSGDAAWVRWKCAPRKCIEAHKGGYTGLQWAMAPCDKDLASGHKPPCRGPAGRAAPSDAGRGARPAEIPLDMTLTLPRGARIVEMPIVSRRECATSRAQRRPPREASLRDWVPLPHAASSSGDGPGRPRLKRCPVS
jgi:hypothetical protein